MRKKEFIKILKVLNRYFWSLKSSDFYTEVGVLAMIVIV
ncbi:hypothetical protein CSCA_0452 [Clostridium scatologenes]|uniref:Uncharacterized protein n=1 Tax=Clostridium scatologenes TaxID=1548 RepID=A0A0E3JYK5_CLOSL|nr:hypothetical protein CSCA_0452 [Clostridium scatologenes]